MFHINTLLFIITMHSVFDFVSVCSSYTKILNFCFMELMRLLLCRHHWTKAARVYLPQ